MAQLLALLASILGFVKSILGIAHDRQVKQQGEDAQVAVQKEQVIATLDKVHDAQVAADRDMQLRPGSVLEDDGFRRD